MRDFAEFGPGTQVQREYARGLFLRDYLYFRKDRAFRKANDHKTAAEMWPLSVGYSPFSGMTPLARPVKTHTPKDTPIFPCIVTNVGYGAASMHPVTAQEIFERLDPTPHVGGVSVFVDERPSNVREA